MNVMLCSHDNDDDTMQSRDVTFVRNNLPYGKILRNTDLILTFPDPR